MRHADSTALSAVGIARRASRPRPALRARPLRRPLPRRAHPFPDRLAPRAAAPTAAVPTATVRATSLGPQPAASPVACRSSPSRRRLHAGERRPTASPHRSSPVELELTLLSLLAVARPPPATIAPPHRGDAAAEPDFFSSPSTRSSGELGCRSPCPMGSLTLVGARPPPFVPPPPL